MKNEGKELGIAQWPSTYLTCAHVWVLAPPLRGQGAENKGKIMTVKEKHNLHDFINSSRKVTESLDKEEHMRQTPGV